MGSLVTSFGQWLEHSSLAYAMDNTAYVFTVVSVLHYFSIFVTVGTSVVVDLGLLGAAGRRHRAAALAGQLLPWMWVALVLAALTGFLMFAPDAPTFFRIGFFSWKLLGMAFSIGAVALIHCNVRKWDEAPTLPPAAKAAAVVSILLWIVTLVMALEIAQFANI